MLCFEGQTKDFWHGELRPGDAHTASGTLDLLAACWKKIPVGVRSVIVRADKGFFDHTLVEWLESRKTGFVIVARLTQPIKRKLAHLRYVTPSRGVEVAEFRYQPTRWPHPYRFVVIRRPQPEEPTAQLTLFKLGRYHYQVLVTNLALRPLNLWRVYNDRAGVELLIRQLETFSGSCQAIFLERCRSCCRAMVARWYDSSYGIWRSHRTKMIFSHFAPNARSAWRWE